MTLALDQLVQQVVDSTLLSAADARALIESLPTEQRPQDADQLAREPARRGKSTPGTAKDAAVEKTQAATPPTSLQ